MKNENLSLTTSKRLFDLNNLEIQMSKMTESCLTTYRTRAIINVGYNGARTVLCLNYFTSEVG